jgi:hypothetical protein
MDAPQRQHWHLVVIADDLSEFPIPAPCNEKHGPHGGQLSKEQAQLEAEKSLHAAARRDDWQLTR